MKKNNIKSFEFKFDSFDDEKGVICGYGAIKGNIDIANDVIKDGAFAETLKVRPNMPFLWQHDPDIQIGVVSCVEDSIGLKMEAKYYLNTTKGKDAYELAKANSENKLPTSFSIGYRTLERSYGEYQGEQVRFLEKLDCREVSQVTFPCNELATSTSIKSEERDIDVRDVEYSLRDAGLSRTEAKKYSSLIKTNLCDAGMEAKDGEGEVVTDETVVIEKTVETVVEVVTEEVVDDKEIKAKQDKESLDEIKQFLMLEILKQQMETL